MKLVPNLIPPRSLISAGGRVIRNERTDSRAANPEISSERRASAESPRHSDHPGIVDLVISARMPPESRASFRVDFRRSDTRARRFPLGGVAVERTKT
jgi:hypothetical protein